MSAPESKLPNLAAFFLIIVGLILGLIDGIGSGSIKGGIIAGLAIVPACWGIWAGMQQESQVSLVWSILLIFASLGIAGLLILLRFADMIF